MTRSIAILLLAAALGGCGLAETGAVAATAGSSAAEEAKQAEKITDQVEADIAAAQHTAAEARRAAEAAAE
jgi:hypothetical protein